MFPTHLVGTLANNENAVFIVICVMQEEYEKGSKVGLDISTGEPLDPQMAGIFDNYRVKRQIIESAPVVASQLLLVDEVMRAGIGMRK